MKILKANNQKGFTLIELLIVVAIIGILATIIVVATADARKKGKDAAVKSSLDTIRKQAAIWYFDNNTYLNPPQTTPRSEVPCTTISNTGGGINNMNMLGSDPIMFEALQEAIDKSYDPSITNVSRCAIGATSWAVAIKLNSSGGGSSTAETWCVDSDGFAGKFAGHTNNNPPHAVCTDTSGATDRYFCPDYQPCP